MRGRKEKVLVWGVGVSWLRKLTNVECVDMQAGVEEVCTIQQQRREEMVSASVYLCLYLYLYLCEVVERQGPKESGGGRRPAKLLCMECQQWLGSQLIQQFLMSKERRQTNDRIR